MVSVCWQGPHGRAKQHEPSSHHRCTRQQTKARDLSKNLSIVQLALFYVCSVWLCLSSWTPIPQSFRKTVRSWPMNMCKKRSVGKAIINLEVRICRQSTKGQEAEGWKYALSVSSSKSTLVPDHLHVCAQWHLNTTCAGWCRTNDQKAQRLCRQNVGYAAFTCVHQFWEASISLPTVNCLAQWAQPTDLSRVNSVQAWCSHSQVQTAHRNTVAEAFVHVIKHDKVPLWGHSETRSAIKFLLVDTKVLTSAFVPRNYCCLSSQDFPWNRLNCIQLPYKKWSNGMLWQQCAGLKATIWNQATPLLQQLREPSAPPGKRRTALLVWIAQWLLCRNMIEIYGKMQNMRALNAPCRILLTNSFTSLTCSRLWRLDGPLVSSQILPQNYPTTLHSLPQHFKLHTNLPRTQSVLRSLRSTFFPRLTIVLTPIYCIHLHP